MSAPTDGSSAVGSLATGVTVPNVFDVENEALVLELLRRIHLSHLTAKEKNELRSAIFAARSTDGGLSPELLELLTAHNIAVPAASEVIEVDEVTSPPSSEAAPRPATTTLRASRSTPSFSYQPSVATTNTPPAMPASKEVEEVAASEPEPGPEPMPAADVLPVTLEPQPEPTLAVEPEPVAPVLPAAPVAPPPDTPASEVAPAMEESVVPSSLQVPITVIKEGGGSTAAEVPVQPATLDQGAAVAAVETPSPEPTSSFIPTSVAEDPVPTDTNSPVTAGAAAATVDASPSPAATAESVPLTVAQPAAPAATSPVNTTARIDEIKRAVNALVGNPINLIDVDNKVGREYMDALLDAMRKSTNGTPKPEMDRALSRLEASYAQVQTTFASSRPAATTPPAEETTPAPAEPATSPSDAVAAPESATAVADAPVEPAPPTSETSVPEAAITPEPETPAEPESAPSPAGENMLSSRRMIEDPNIDTTDLRTPFTPADDTFLGGDPEPALSTPPAPPVAVSEPVAEPEPTVPDSMTKPGGAWTSDEPAASPAPEPELPAAPTLASEPPEPEPTPPAPEPAAEESVSWSDQAASAAEPPASPAADTPPAPEETPADVDPTGVTPLTSVAKGKQISELMDARKDAQKAALAARQEAEAQNPLMSEQVTRGLQQLLSEWKLFKSSGFFGTGPSGDDHPLYKRLAPLTMAAVVAGRFEGATPEIRQNIAEYMNGWRYEQGIVHELGENFEHYLRRVIFHIVSKKAAERK